MIALVALHLVVAPLGPVLIRLMDRRAFYVLASVPLLSLAYFLWATSEVTGSAGKPITQNLPWIESLGVSITFTLTPLTWLISLLVTGVGALVMIYSANYFKEGDTELWRFSATLTGFAGSMLGLVLSADLIMLFIFWELTTVFSYILIGHNPARKANRRAAMNALLVTTFGGLAMLVGIVILGDKTGTYNVYEVMAAEPSGALVSIAIGLLVIGALSKSALVPFHFWLPGAMAAPTPVSAFLHAAAMVKAGVFLLALLAPAFADTPGWRPVLITLGVWTMLIGGLRALRQYDIKVLLAYGTVSQLGFLTVVVGIGTQSAIVAGLAMLTAHAFFKAALFLIVGIIDRRTGTRDLRLLSGMRRYTPKILIAATFVSAFSMAGIPPLLGFVAKEATFLALTDLSADTGLSTAWTWLAVIGVAIGSIFTVAYTARFLWGIFGDKPDVADCEPRRETSWQFMLAPVFLSFASLIAGFAGPALVEALVPYTSTFEPGAHKPSLDLWHGFNLALLLSIIAIVAGVAMFIWRQHAAYVQHLIADRIKVIDAERGFYASMRGIDRLAVEVTAITQRGSLPIYLSVTLLVFGSLAGYSIFNMQFGLTLKPWDNVSQFIVGVLITVAAIAAVRSRRRLRAVLLAGATGYGTAMLFLLHGGPDLALTQVLVETITLVVFVLVLRRLPTYFNDRPLTRTRFFRVALGVATGFVVALAVLFAGSARTADPIGYQFAKYAEDFGGGKNIVNVTIVDIRAWDTMGELSVLVVAATGVASLIFLIQSRSARIPRVTQFNQTPQFTGRTWLHSGEFLDPAQRSVVFEVVTRVIFYPIIIFSVYLVFIGHNLPGGGFAGGLAAGMALMMRYLAGGRVELNEAAPVDAGVVLGLGLTIATTSGLVPLLLGFSPLQSAIVDIPFGPLGELHLVTSVFFDLGVYLVVIGLVLDILRSLGGGIDRQTEEVEEATA